MTKRKVRRVPGDIVLIDLGEGHFSLARILTEPLVEFFDQMFHDDDPPTDMVAAIENLPVAFRVDVMNYAISGGRWPVVGHIDLTEAERSTTVRFFKQDMITGKLTIYCSDTHTNQWYEIPATREECEGLERLAVWDPHHVEDRLRDHFAGRPNIWVESLAIEG